MISFTSPPKSHSSLLNLTLVCLSLLQKEVLTSFHCAFKNVHSLPVVSKPVHNFFFFLPLVLKAPESTACQPLDFGLTSSLLCWDTIAFCSYWEKLWNNLLSICSDRVPLFRSSTLWICSPSHAISEPVEEGFLQMLRKDWVPLPAASCLNSFSKSYVT